MSQVVSGSVTFPNCGNTSHFGSERTGLPCPIEAYKTPNGNYEIKPLEGGDIGYGLGRALRMGFDYLYPRVSDVVRSMIANLPSSSFMPIGGVSAAEIFELDSSIIPQKNSLDRKKIIKNDQNQQLCQPSIISSIEFSGTPQNVAVLDNYAYVTTWSDSGYDGLQIVNIANPSNPVYESYSVWGSYGVSVPGKYAYMTDDNGLEVVDISNPLEPALVGSYEMDSAMPIIVSGKYAYVGLFDDILQIIDITNPANPSSISSYSTGGGVACGIGLLDDCVFLAYGSGLQIVNVTNPFKPSLLGSYYMPGTGRDIALSEKHAFIADYASGLQIFDVSNPANPHFVSSYYTPKGAWSVAFSDNYVFVGDNNSTLHILDVNNPLKPVNAGSYHMSSTIAKMTILNNYIYAVCFNNELHIIQSNCPSSSTTSSSNGNPSFNKGILLGAGIGGGMVGLGVFGTSVTYCLIKRRKSASTNPETKALLNS